MATPAPGKVVEDVDDAPSPAVQDHQDLEKEDTVEFVDPLPKDYECPLCLQVQKDPTLTSCCGHHFCQPCINRVIARDHICPLCKDHGFQTFLDKSAGRNINALKIYCKLKSRGCQWVGELGRLEHHSDVREGNCGFVEVECDFSPVGCVLKLLRRDLPAHREEYVHTHLALMSVMSLKTADEFDRRLREQRAEFQQQLQEKDEQLEAILHRNDQQFQEQKDVTGRMLQEKDQQIQCLQKEIGQLREKDQQRLFETRQQFKKHEEQLTKLGEERRREAKELEGRIQSESDERKQEFAKLREEVKEQTKQDVASHTRDIQEKDKQVKELWEQMKERIRDLEIRVYNVPTTVPFEFTMPEFSKHKANNTEWRSPPFYSHPGGYKFCIEVSVNGRGLYRGHDKVSYTICKVRTNHDDLLKWDRKIPITIQLLNQRTGKWDFEIVDGDCYNRSRPDSEYERSGWDCLTTHSVLGPYLKNDSLQFRIAKVELW